MTAPAPFFSVVVPVRDGGAVFELCLEALSRSTFRDFELVVVDDGPGTGDGEVARRHGAWVVTTSGGEGPGAARNLGARAARGEYLFFIDADCEVHADTLARAAHELRADPELDALFGSYDDAPAAPGVVSRFRNLLHHYVHHQGDPEARTFWAGCGAMHRRTFLELGGFDHARYPRPSIEDIELGYRLTAGGGRIRLVPEVQVRHHKRWTLSSMLRTDIRDRGIPWTRLILERGRKARELNVALPERISVLLVAVGIAGLVGAFLDPRALVASAGAGIALVVLHRHFYGFLLDHAGPAFCVASIVLHQLHYAAAGTAYTIGWLWNLGGRAR